MDFFFFDNRELNLKQLDSRSLFIVNFELFLSEKKKINIFGKENLRAFFESISWVSLIDEYRKISDMYLFKSFYLLGTLVDVLYLLDLKQLMVKNALNFLLTPFFSRNSFVVSQYTPNFFPFYLNFSSSYFVPMLSEKVVTNHFSLKLFFCFSFSFYLAKIYSTYV